MANNNTQQGTMFVTPPPSENSTEKTGKGKGKGKEEGIWRLWAYIGPGFLVCIAYVDPGNFETDFQAGADFKFKLLWVLLWATCAALLIQSLAANLGVATGQHLAEHCRTEYSRNVNYFLWIAAEVSIIASDVPEGIDTRTVNTLINLGMLQEKGTDLVAQMELLSNTHVMTQQVTTMQQSIAAQGSGSKAPHTPTLS
ncbi:hypothetical protein L7F22_041063 [Adiantum nelumboides]|nr:hypothetical protein [Adiantum nelumboides]